MTFFPIGRSRCPPSATAIRPGYGLEHSPSFATYIAIIQCHKVLALRSVTTREVVGEEIGDYAGSRALIMPHPDDLAAPFQHCKSLEELRIAVQKHLDNRVTPINRSRLNAPIITELSTSPFHPHDPVPLLSDSALLPSQVHAAITFVNDLSGSLRLPCSFTLPIHQQYHANDIGHVLMSKFSAEIPCATRAHLVEKYPTTPLKLYLWVMPQGLEHGSMYLWQSGPLEQFLSAAYVAGNDRRLYLEARLAPAIAIDIKTDQCAKNNDPTTAEISEDDDLETSLLSLTDSSQSDSSIVYSPDSDISTSRIGLTTQVDSLPPRQIDNLSQCSVIVHFDTTNLPDVNNQVFRRPNYTVPLEATPRLLSKVLRLACADFRKLQSAMMHSLKSAGKGLHMRSFTAFNDERDSYLRRDETQSSRIAKLSDLFLSRKSLRSSPEIPIVVKMDIINLTPEVEAFDSASYGAEHEYYAYHRVSTASSTRPSPFKRLNPRIQPAVVFGPEEEVQLHPIQTALVTRYPRLWPIAGPLVGITYREVNGVVLGDTRYVDEDPRRDGQIWVEKYRDLESSEKRQRAVYENMISESELRGIREGVPISPSLTFLPFVGKGAELNGERMHVAVRIVNSLQGSKVPVPLGVVVKVMDGEGMKEVICAALSRKLREFYEARALKAGLGMLKDEGKWRWDLWVLPQKVVGDAMVMYTFREGSLKVFLDEGMVKGGVRTLYMEAHIVE